MARGRKIKIWIFTILCSWFCVSHCFSSSSVKDSSCIVCDSIPLSLKNLHLKDSETSRSLIDSLNTLSYNLRYKNLQASCIAAKYAYDLAIDYEEGRAEALNNKAFVSLMHMDFEKASSLFSQVHQETDNEVERLLADIGMMKVCQRTSLNKEFYDYRNSSLYRMNRIVEDIFLFADSPRLLSRFNYARSEFYIVSGIYYYYLQQANEAMNSINAISNEWIASDESQSLYYSYMRGSGGMYEASTPEAVVTGEFEVLVECLNKAHKGGYVYFEANSLQAMAELLNYKSNRELIMKQRSRQFRLFTEDNISTDSIPLFCAERALSLFKEYDDWYQISGTYRTLASYYNQQNQPSKALACLKKALEYVNKHHQRYYEGTDSLGLLSVYNPYNNASIELQWIQDPHIKTVPEWILRLREQLSITYAAMGMKLESDYNRNMYLDILDYTRQDKELESRYELLQTETRQLNMLFFLVLAGSLVVIVVFWGLNRYWRKRNVLYLSELRNVMSLCRKITGSIPPDASQMEEVVHSICLSVEDDLKNVFGISELRINLKNDIVGNDEYVQSCRVLDASAEADDLSTVDKLSFQDKADESSQSSNNSRISTSSTSRSLCGLFKLVSIPYCLKDEVERVYSYDIFSSDSHTLLAVVGFRSERILRKEELSMLRFMLPYITWALENGMNLVSLDDERKKLEKEQYVHELHLIENKRSNITRKACLSIVTGMLPYIDRVVNEVSKLQSAKSRALPSLIHSRLEYMSELIDRINEYNDILALWIKMRQGSLNLKIEKFGLHELFSIVTKSKHSFEQKHQILEVSDTDSVVKADKALTLFMINTLLENARKYTSDGGKVCLKAEETEKYVEVSVIDNGPGLSRADIQRILGEKVYDSSQIGLDSAEDTEKLKSQKGSGFGLMNCKGIIDKYRKLNPLFSVSCFGIESKLKEGSRFFFRLPKGGKMLGLMFFVVSICLSSCTFFSSHSSDEKSSLVSIKEESLFSHVVSEYDSLLSVANDFTGKVYDANVRGEYGVALAYADSVVHYMNMHYRRYSGHSQPLINLYDAEGMAELNWLKSDFDTDFYILLDVRNEVAVACLALKDFNRYQVNNQAYTALYKQISEDNNLEYYCIAMQQSANNKTIAITFFVLLVITAFVIYYVVYVRRRLNYRYNMEQVFSVNDAVLSASVIQGGSERDIIRRIVDDVFLEFNEIIAIGNLCLSVYDEETQALLHEAYSSDYDEELLVRIQHRFDVKQTAWDAYANWLYYPLWIEGADDRRCIGVLSLRPLHSFSREEDLLLIELIANYMAIVLNNTIVKVKRKYHDIELALDEARRVVYEENKIHVQNMVLDNCLSVIKHETIYYPSRIKQIIDQQLQSYTRQIRPDVSSWNDISELVAYYRSIFTLLTSCAARQLDDIVFRRGIFPVARITEHAKRYFDKTRRRLSIDVHFQLDSMPVEAVGDELLIKFLIENLIDESLRKVQAGNISLSVVTLGNFVKFSYTDYRFRYSRDELDHLFYPNKERMYVADNGGMLIGTEYLICKQIIREHDEYAGTRGCRINAAPLEGKEGFVVWFTIPLKK